MSATPPVSPFPGGSRPGGTGPAGSQSAATPSGCIGRYQILDKIGEGGMGSLHLARDPAIDRLVAIKVLRRGFDTEAMRERFAREARAAGRLRHPHIVTIFDVGEHDGDPFIAMEFLAGETLGELIRHGAGLSLSRRLKLLEELCDGLAYAHRAGLVHRDIKPANLMVDAEGALKILDFGIVRGGESGMTQAGMLVGTINYMSPEQVIGTAVDHRSDIFAVGLVAYELLSSRQAFPGTMKDGLLRRIPNAEIDPLAGVAPDLDPDVVKIVEHALQKEPADRYQELARMRNDLARVRQRIEVEEERAAVLAASGSEETAFLAEEVTAPGVPTESPQDSGPNLIADAERALAEGNYRFALTMAGRAAAVNPQDRSPGTIVARAEAALLERGRVSDASPPAPPPNASSIPAPLAALPPAPGAATAATATVAHDRAMYLAVAVAVVALLVAGFAVWSQTGRADRPTDVGGDAARQPSNDVPQPGAAETPAPVTPAKPLEAPPAVAVEQPADPPQQPPPAPRPASRDTRAAESRGRAGAPPTSERPTPNAERMPRDQSGRVPSPPPELTRADPAPVRPTVPGLPVTGAPSTLPGTAGAPPVAPVPPARAPDKAAKPPAEPAVEAPAPRDPRADIRSALARYEAAWEALDADALMRVQVVPDAARIRRDMADMREYEIEIAIQSITVAPDGRSATAACRVTRRFRGVPGGRVTQEKNSTFALEQRGETWMITGLR